MSRALSRGVELFDEWEIPNARVRNKTRGRQGVYLLSKRGVVRYVGSSISGPDAAPLRMWKTIMRHFQACGPVAPGRYGFGEDNWCTSSRKEWRIALLLLSHNASPEMVRAVEDEQIVAHKPTEQAQKKKPKKDRRRKPRR